MDINKSIAQAYINMYEASCNSGKKTKRESWVPETVADEDVADFMGAAAAAAKAGKKEFKFGDKTYKVTMKKSTVDAISEKDAACLDCGKVHEGSCMKEEADLEEAAPKINMGKAKGSISATGLRGKGMKKYDVDVSVKNGKLEFRIKDEQGKFQTVNIKTAARMLGEEVEDLEEVTKDSDKLEPRAKGEKDFKKIHDDNTEIHDEEKNDEENFKNIKKSADAIKK